MVSTIMPAPTPYTLPTMLSDAESEIFHLAATTEIPHDQMNPKLVGGFPEIAQHGLQIDDATAAHMPPVIGLHGKPGAGKDTIAWIIALGLASVGRRARVIGTSDPVIQEANAYLAPFKREVGHGNKSWGPYRRLLQTIGESRRRGDENYWNKAHYANIARIRAEEVAAGNGDPVIFITGIRTPSDMELIQGPPLAGPVVRVYRDGNPYQADHWIERQLDHLPDSAFQGVIHNHENDMSGLYTQLLEMCAKLATIQSNLT